MSGHSRKIAELNRGHQGRACGRVPCPRRACSVAATIDAMRFEKAPAAECCRGCGDKRGVVWPRSGPRPPKSISIIAGARSIRILNGFLIENIASSLHVSGALPTFGLRPEFLWANRQEDIG